MSAPEGIREQAQQRAEQLFEGRCRRAGLRPDQTDQHVQCEADEPQPYPGGWQVRVRTWRHWSDATVHFNADNGEILHRYLDRLADPPTSARLTQEDAVRIAGEHLSIPPEAELESFSHEQFADGGRQLARAQWRHVYRGLRVDGDYLWALVHPETHELVAWGRKWRSLGTE